MGLFKVFLCVSVVQTLFGFGLPELGDLYATQSKTHS
jgi:hypothetical protein